MSCHATFMFALVAAPAPDACSTAEGRCHRDDHAPRYAPLWLAEDMCRRRSMPDIGRREKHTDVLCRHSLVGFPPGDNVEPRHTPVRAPSYLFGVGTATTRPFPRPAEALHTSTAEDNAPRLSIQLLEPHSVSQRTFARTPGPPRARPCSFPSTCADDEDYFVQGLLGSTTKDNMTFKRACLRGMHGSKPSTQTSL